MNLLIKSCTKIPLRSLRYSSSLSFYERYIGPESMTAKPSFNKRWLMFAPTFMTHVCLGSPYGWSAISSTLTKELGFVVSSASDWSLDHCTYPMSIIIAAGGISAAILGKMTMKIGTRASLLLGGTFLGTAFVVSGFGIAQHSLPLLYFGNLMAGFGYGWSYTPPIQTILDWYPDKRGLASGVVIAGFGSGALFFTPMMNHWIQTFSKMPTYLGDKLETLTENGKLFVQIGSELQEVVYATKGDLAKLPFSDLMEGFYLVGSGDTGTAKGLALMGLIYGATILSSAMMIRKPAPGYLPQGYTPVSHSSGGGNTSVHVNNLIKTPQFWLLFSTSTLLATGGMGLMSVAKPMINDVFTTSIPHIVTASFASYYLMAMAGGNLAGRLGWAVLSDKIGRRATFNIFTMASIPLFASLPYTINQVILNPTSPMTPLFLGAFCGATISSISIMGGTFAVLPAYEADLYGPKYVQAIHGRFLLAATTSTIAGPFLLLTLRNLSERAAIESLLSKVDVNRFQHLFGTDLSQTQSLIDAKTLTISKLMTIMPPGTLDPSPFIYNNTMLAMASLVTVGAALHILVKPVDKKYFEKSN